jgi:hypothetical protein
MAQRDFGMCVIPTRIESDSAPKQSKCEGSSAFLKKSTKKLLFSSVRIGRIRRANQWSKIFLVLFFKKELLSCCADMSVATRIDITVKNSGRGHLIRRLLDNAATKLGIGHGISRHVLALFAHERPFGGRASRVCIIFSIT